MVNIKSLVLGFFSSLLFTIAFLAFFAFLVLANLPEEIDNLEKILSDNLPNIILNSITIKTKISNYIETSLFNNSDEQTIQMQLLLMRAQCVNGVNSLSEDLSHICPDLVNGKINNKEDFKNALTRSFEIQLKEQINEGLKPAFSELKASLSSFGQFKIWILIISLALFFIAAMIVYFDSFNLAKTLNTVLWRVSISSLSFILPFLLFSVLSLFGVNFENILIDNLQKNIQVEDPQAFIDQETMNEILEPMVKLILDWVNVFFFKRVVIFAVICVVGFVSWHFTRVQNQK